MIILLFTLRDGTNFIFTMLSIFAPLIGYVIAEIIIGNKVRKRVVENEYKLKPRDVQGENKMVRKYTIITTSIYILGIIVFKFLI